ncbi:MAG: SurA N-terminal domain-containing protein [Deltaproteobacteria bacterium]|jgi:hypothetical protein|nr:SurA N-terminal domain-containing protein [Deltaproteobacteria bacterium]
MKNLIPRLYKLKLYLIVIVLIGCADSDSNVEDEYLIRLGNRSVTVLEFNEAFEIAKIAYPHQIKDKPEDLKKAQLRLINQLMIELMVLERAQELGIELSEAEVENAIAEIKGDYPEGVFEETLLEVAVSYETWVKRLKTRLIMEKVIDQELKDKIVITPGDISIYYEENFKGKQQSPEFNEDSGDINEAIIKILRRKKLEEAYGLWINELKSKYNIEVNNTHWERISGVEKFSEKDLKLDVPPNQLQ